MELSIVIPCLNESETIQTCINKIKQQLKKNNIDGEIILADNGSTDGSIEIAKKNNLKIINVAIKGYGSAVRTGIKNAIGKYVFVADADDSYDFNEIPKFYKKIIEGYDIVQGCRLPAGGGKIKKNAMPITHRLIGNPLFSFLAKKIYGLNINDVYCGMKIFNRKVYEKMFFFTNGMVFCLEILIKFKQFNYKMCELPITLHRDGRVRNKSHLNTIKDGLKTLKFLLIFSPKWFFFFPSIIFFVGGILGSLLQFKNFQIFNTNILIFLLISILIGNQLLMLGFYSFLRSEELGFKKNEKVHKFFKYFTLKKSIIISFLGIVLSYSLYYYNENFNFIYLNIYYLSILIFLIFFNLLINTFFVSLLKINN